MSTTLILLFVIGGAIAQFVAQVAAAALSTWRANREGKRLLTEARDYREYQLAKEEGGPRLVGQTPPEYWGEYFKKKSSAEVPAGDQRTDCSQTAEPSTAHRSDRAASERQMIPSVPESLHSGLQATALPLSEAVAEGIESHAPTLPGVHSVHRSSQLSPVGGVADVGVTTLPTGASAVAGGAA